MKPGQVFCWAIAAIHQKTQALKFSLVIAVCTFALSSQMLTFHGSIQLE